MVTDVDAKKETARAVCGSENLKLSEFVGMTVAAIRSEYGDLLNIPGDATALVNGKSKEDSYTLKAKDELVFSRPVGQKG